MGVFDGTGVDVGLAAEVGGTVEVGDTVLAIVGEGNTVGVMISSGR